MENNVNKHIPVYFSREAYEIVKLMQEENNTLEWALLLDGKIVRGGKPYLLVDKAIIPNQKMKSTTVDILEEQPIDIITSPHNGHLHSHVNMGVTMSVTDVDTFDEFYEKCVRCEEEITYNIIINNKDELSCSLYIRELDITHTFKDIIRLSPFEIASDSEKDIIKDRIDFIKTEIDGLLDSISSDVTSINEFNLSLEDMLFGFELEEVPYFSEEELSELKAVIENRCVDSTKVLSKYNNVPTASSKVGYGGNKQGKTLYDDYDGYDIEDWGDTEDWYKTGEITSTKSSAPTTKEKVKWE